MNEEMTEQPLLTRDGHLTDLTIDRYMAAELPEAAVAVVTEHMSGCADCEARFDAIRALDADFTIQPPIALFAAAEENVVSLAERRPSQNWIVAVLAAAAAIALVFVARSDQQPLTPGEPDDGIRIKGSGLALEVFAKTDGAEPRRVAKGDVVHPGDRLGFKITSREVGYVMIVGIDDAGQVYGGWPQGAAPQAKFLEPRDGPRELEAAVQLDDVGSQETLVLVRCPERFDLAAATMRLKSRTSLDHEPPQDSMSRCVYDEVPLKKQPR